MTLEIPEEKIEEKPSWWQWFENRGDGPVGMSLLAAAAMLDSIIIFFPPEIILAALVLAKPKKWIFYTLFTVLFTTVGAIITYILGAFFFDLFGTVLVSFVGGESVFVEVQKLFNLNVILGLLFVGVTPIPWVPFLLAAGVFKVNFGAFLIGVVLARVIRFGVIAFLVAFFGKPGLALVLRTLRFLGTTGIIISIVAVIIVASLFVQFFL
ncbi:hypothetical protein COB87_000880 [Candidatus Wolfebacteria bacterium]|nr:hypothetical protein [Candidatus Wolfebacteria bacterium]